jgi:hypothetical protein
MKILGMVRNRFRLAVPFVMLLALAPTWLYAQVKPAAPTITVYKTPT